MMIMLGWFEEPVGIDTNNPDELAARAAGLMHRRASLKDILKGLVYAHLATRAQLKWNLKHRNDIELNTATLDVVPEKIKAGVLQARLVTMPKLSPCCGVGVDEFGVCGACSERVSPITQG